MASFDFAAHNAEVERIWQAYHSRQPIRVPMIINVSTRYTLFHPQVNPEARTFRDYFDDPDFMFRHQLDRQWWLRHHMIFDGPMGPPQEWVVNVDLQNSYEALWFGCPLEFWDDQCPDTRPILGDDNKRALFDRGLPEPFPTTGYIARAWEYYDQFCDRATREEFHGAPIRVGSVPGVGTDGPFTAACSIRGGTALMIDMLTDTDYYMELMDFITTATIQRIRAYRKRLGQPVESQAWGFADDSVQMLSAAQYEIYVLPFHRRLIEEFGRLGPNSIHLCGDVQHLLPVIQRELNVQSFDTGFPLDHGALRQVLGPDAQILGGPHVATVHAGPPPRIRKVVREILQSGVMEGGRFILHEGNNLPPGTPLSHIAAMYEACREFGRY
ncbi:MAG: uroporphyrinogen decarboxylase family protein [Candidatus Zipacnadales bacterium]